jgi:arginyl-tRNA synthetase
MTTIQKIEKFIDSVIKNHYPEVKETASLTDKIPKQSQHIFDVASNICMIIAKKYNENINEVGSLIINDLKQNKYIKNAELEAGFLNIKLSEVFFCEFVKHCIEEKENFPKIDLQYTELKKINLEFVSANPTGPLHIGHVRNAILGDCISRILKKIGHKITKEYYINDAGSQIDKILNSVEIRFKQLHTNSLQEKIPEDCYPGEYVIEVAKQLPKNTDFKHPNTKQEIVKILTEDIKKTLISLGIEFDVFTSELFLHESGKIEEFIKILQEKNLIKEAELEAPKGKEKENYISQPTLLFKSTEFGDEVDRPLKKQDGEWTYLAGDGAYALDKISRGFNSHILLLGADHKGYVKRLIGVAKSIKTDVEVDVKLGEIVNFIKNGEPVKMSKRAGNFLTVDDVLNEIHVDILKFIILTKKMETVINFDLEKAKEQSKDNPVFYVQYASGRCNSVLSKIPNHNTDKIEIPHELHKILIKMNFFKDAILNSAKYLEPNLITQYIIELSELFHNLWHTDIKLQEGQTPEETNGIKLSLICFKNTLTNALDLLGIKALERI